MARRKSTRGGGDPTRPPTNSPAAEKTEAAQETAHEIDAKQDVVASAPGKVSESGPSEEALLDTVDEAIEASESSGEAALGAGMFGEPLPNAREPAASEPEPEIELEHEHHDTQSEEYASASFASRALWFLCLLLAGAALGIWAAPKIAPKLPSGMASVSEWLAPGQSGGNEAVAELETRLNADLGDVKTQLGVLSTQEAPPQPDIGAAVDAAVKTAVDTAAAATSDSEARISTEIAKLRDDVKALDATGTAQRLSRIEAAIDGQKAELGAIKTQLTGGAQATSKLSEQTVASIDLYRAELDGLRAEMGTQSDKVSGLASRIDEVAANADREIETARASVAGIELRTKARVDEIASSAQSRVDQIEADATTAVGTASTQSDIAAVQAAMASGASFPDALARLGGQPDVSLPDGLSAAADTGVQTLTQLVDAFPDAAHAALRANIIDSSGDGVIARSQAFLRAQISSRSLAPKEGMAPDAVLSRMEESLRHENLAGAVAEADSLPGAATAAMSGWLDAARLRVNAENGLAALSAGIPATN
jgi:hypothetical protein